MGMLLAGMDIGSTNCKIGIYDDSGRYIQKFSHQYTLVQQHQVKVLTGKGLWQAVTMCLSEAFAKYPEIAAVTITSFGESFVLLDKADQPLFPIMMYSDSRGAEQAAKMQQELSVTYVAEETGAPVHYMFSLPKLLWLKENCPTVLKHTYRILLIQDYIVYCLSGVAQIDYSLAARTLAFSIRNKEWSRNLFDYAGLSTELMSVPVAAGTMAGRLKTSLAEKWHVKCDVFIISGCHDQVAAAAGAGIFESGTAVDGAGTVECITPLVKKLPDMNLLARGGIAVVPYVLPEQYVCYAFSFAGGALLQWYIENFVKGGGERIKYTGGDIYRFMEDGMDTMPGQVLLLPHFNGAATPYMDGEARGAIVGLTLKHTKRDLYKAVMEGVAYEMQTNICFLENAGIPIHRLHATGGGAKSSLWLQIKANVLNRELKTLHTEEAGTVGSAMLAAVAMGCYSNMIDASAAFVQQAKSFIPQPEYSCIYRERYKKYQGLYEAMKTFR